MSSKQSVLAQAADAARFAPSIHNTQPWRWVVRADSLELFGVPERQLPEQDPQGRLLLLSCGTALHHAQVALDAEGWQYRTDVTVPAQLTTGQAADPAAADEPADRAADRAADEPIATIRLTSHEAVRAEATRHFQMIQVRRTDRRTVTDDPVPDDVLQSLVKSVEEAGAGLQLLERDQVLELAVAVEHAQKAEGSDDRVRAELASWVGGERPDGTGIPASALPDGLPLTTVADRDFQAEGSVAPGEGHGLGASYALLHGTGDEGADWLRAGVALSRLWLAATEQAVSVLPLSGPVEIPFTRQALYRMLGGAGHPYLALRLGTLDPAESAPPHTPRLPTGQVIEVVPE